MKHLISALLIFVSILVLQSCGTRSQANVSNLISNDCGQTWELVKVGERIPMRQLSCELSTTIPNSPMVGSIAIKATFANKVKAQVKVDYEYIIEDPILFITEAKYLARTNSDADDVSSNSSRFESAENSIIDKRLTDIARDTLDGIDIVEFEQSEFENYLLDYGNKMVSERGVRITFLSFVPEMSEQTEQAIDVAQAMKIFDSKGLGDLGKEVIARRAGASRIMIGAESTQQ